MIEPEWATPLINSVMQMHGRTHRPIVKWLETDHPSSSGWAYPSNYHWHYGRRGMKYRKERVDILIRQSSVKIERFVLLHEMSHWLLRHKHHHDKVFWRKAWELYFKFLMPEEIEGAKTREFAYMGKAKQVYEELRGGDIVDDLQKVPAGFHKWALRPTNGLSVKILRRFMTQAEVDALIDKYMVAKKERMIEVIEAMNRVKEE